MLWSLFKIILFVAVIALLAVGAGQLMETSGGIRVAVGSTELNLQPLQAVIVGVLLVLAIWAAIILIGLLIAFIRFVNGDDTAISRYFDRSRERKGYEALAEGMIALASGEGSTAMSKASRAEKYLRRPELTNLLTAQAAEMSGDKKKAGEVYRRLLKDEKTQFVGVRGIMKQKLIEGDTDTAMKLAQKAFVLKPRHTETQDVLLGLQARGNDWSGARKTLGAKLKYGALPRDVHKRRDAVLALSEAKGILNEGDDIKAREAAIEANRLSPDLVPAAVMAARSYIEDSKPKYATRVLTKAWNAQPHPELAAAFADIVPDETPVERLKRFRALIKHNEDNPETQMLKTELSIAADDFVLARKALGSLPDDMPTQRALTLLAAIERGEGADDQTVRALLARAVTAPRGPQWVCDNCNHVHAAWSPICDNCEGFDTLAWKPAPETESTMQGSAGMLPLIVGDADVVGDDLDHDQDVTPDAEVLDGDVVISEDEKREAATTS